MMKIKVSVKSARETWNGCQVSYIKNVCGGRCCATGGGKSHIAILPSEEAGIRSLGGSVTNGVLDNKPGGGCPFWKDGLCSIHTTGMKPLTCWTSPFTLNANNTLIVKNRNRRLKCYKANPRTMTYKAYKSSLINMFGQGVADDIEMRLDAGATEDFFVEVPDSKADNLHWLINKTKESLANG